MAKGFGKNQKIVKNKSSVLGYMIFEPSHDDFLSTIKEVEGLSQISWCKHPSGAKLFPKEIVAKEVAELLLRDKPSGYSLVICKLSDKKDEYQVEEVGTVVRK